jgi:hypothetical protein
MKKVVAIVNMGAFWQSESFENGGKTICFKSF